MNIWLHGNGHWCQKCKGTGRGRALDRIEYSNGCYCQFYATCDGCNGKRRLAGDGPELPAPRTIFSGCIEYGRITNP